MPLSERNHLASRAGRGDAYQERVEVAQIIAPGHLCRAPASNFHHVLDSAAVRGKVDVAALTRVPALIWVGFMALFRGIGQIVLAFGIRREIRG